MSGLLLYADDFVFSWAFVYTPICTFHWTRISVVNFDYLLSPDMG